MKNGFETISIFYLLLYYKTESLIPVGSLDILWLLNIKLCFIVGFVSFRLPVKS